MHMGSYSVLRNLAPQLGFRIVSHWLSPAVYSQVLLQKTGDIPLAAVGRPSP
jgi:hypothetical protein